jgi:hypothetical protein
MLTYSYKIPPTLKHEFQIHYNFFSKCYVRVIIILNSM